MSTTRTEIDEFDEEEQERIDEATKQELRDLSKKLEDLGNFVKKLEYVNPMITYHWAGQLRIFSVEALFYAGDLPSPNPGEN